MSEWQPIETAPKDGFKLVLLWDSRRFFIGYYSPWDARWIERYDTFNKVWPTHLMPIPAVPEEEE